MTRPSSTGVRSEMVCVKQVQRQTFVMGDDASRYLEVSTGSKVARGGL